MEHGKLHSVSEIEGDDFQQLDLYSIDTLVETEDADSPISKVLEYWLELRQIASPIPRAEDLRFERLWRMKVPDRVTITDCASDDPRNFKVLHHACNVSDRPWFFNKSITGQPFSTFPCPILATALQSEYAIVKSQTEIRSLRYQRVDQLINGLNRHYMRLLLPFSDEGGDVIRIAAVHRWLPGNYIEPSQAPLST